MPERPLTIATYAAGASLAAVTLVYVFGPTFFLDDSASNSSRATRKKGVVGLVNPANDCFINSVLQALAGLPELRAYLIREVHRRALDGEELYLDLTAAEEEARRNKKSREVPDWKIVGQQQGLVTLALKEVLDALNERPIYKKTISAQAFIRSVESAFRTRISRSQQDAQEFLQVVVERLSEEHAAGKRVRRKARQVANGDDGEPAHTNGETTDNEDNTNDDSSETVFPLEGKLESQVECSHCHFKPKPSVNSFLTLTLNVPHDSTSSTLAACFDQLLKVEHIDDFTCDRCRLTFALEALTKTLARPSLTPEERAEHTKYKDAIESALENDPEKPPKDVPLPPLSATPKRRIARHVRISSFPQILTLHLSRSVWDSSAASSKNLAKVSFPETLPLGGLIQRKTYRLLGVVTHKGGHNSGHYESFRRQVLPQPYSTKASLGTEGIFSHKNSPVPSPRGSAVNSPRLNGMGSRSTIRTGQASPEEEGSSTASETDLQELSSRTSHLSVSETNTSTPSSPTTLPEKKRPAVPLDAIPTPGLPSPPAAHPSVSNLKSASETGSDAPSSGAKRQNSMRDVLRRKGKEGGDGGGSNRWWRISDEKVKECKTGDVLGMQREVYLLFYERVG